MHKDFSIHWLQSNTHCFCRDHLDQVDLLVKMDQMDRLAPLDPLDLVDVLENLVLLCVKLAVPFQVCYT